MKESQPENQSDQQPDASSQPENQSDQQPDASSQPENQPYQQHDTAFKWLISKFPYDFFAVFFPEKSVQHIKKLDKEFVQKLEQYKAPVEADLLMALQTKVNGQRRDVIVLLELKSRRADIRAQLHSYCLHAVALFGKAVWPIVLYTDDVDWQVSDAERIPVFYSAEAGLLELVIDLIKIKQHQAETLSKQPNLLARLLALKANDASTTRNQVVAAIYNACKTRDQLDDETMMLVERFVKQYSNLSQQKVNQIKEAVGMAPVASSITEHYLMEGRAEGRAEGEQIGRAKGREEGKQIGRAEGEILGQLKSLKDLHDYGLIETEIYRKRSSLLRKQLKAIREKFQ